MDLIGDLFKGMVILSLMALAQEGCSVKQMAGKAVEAHKKGLSSYGGYSRSLTGSGKSWAKDK